jgi:hypothetical protein
MSIPGMSIPGMSIPPGTSGATVGVGEVPDMSIPGMSIGISAGGLGVGEVPDMSIPGMSIGISGAPLGTGGSSKPKPEATAEALTAVTADASCEVSINDPSTAVVATVAATEASRIRRRHPGCRQVGWLWLGDALSAGRCMRPQSLPLPKVSGGFR